MGILNLFLGVITFGGSVLVEKMAENVLDTSVTKWRKALIRDFHGDIGERFLKLCKKSLIEEFKILAEKICLDKKNQKIANKLFVRLLEEGSLEILDIPKKEKKYLSLIKSSTNEKDKLENTVNQILDILNTFDVKFKQKYKDNNTILVKNIHLLLNEAFIQRVYTVITEDDDFKDYYTIETLREMESALVTILEKTKEIDILSENIELLRSQTLEIVEEKIPRKLEFLLGKHKDEITQHQRNMTDEILVGIKSQNVPLLKSKKIEGFVSLENFLGIGSLAIDEEDYISGGNWPNFEHLERGEVIVTDKMREIIENWKKQFFEERIQISFLTADMASGKTTTLSQFAYEIYKERKDTQVYFLKKGALYSNEIYENFCCKLEELNQNCLKKQDFRILIIFEDAHLFPENSYSIIKKINEDYKQTIQLLVVAREVFWQFMEDIQQNELIKERFPFSYKLSIETLKKQAIHITESERQNIAIRIINLYYDQSKRRLQFKKEEYQNEILDFIKMEINENKKINLYAVKFALMTFDDSGKLDEKLFSDRIIRYLLKICESVANLLKNKLQLPRKEIIEETAEFILALSFYSRYEIAIPINEWIKSGFSKEIAEILSYSGFLVRDGNRIILGHSTFADLIINSMDNYHSRHQSEMVPQNEYTLFSTLLQNLKNKCQENLSEFEIIINTIPNSIKGYQYSHFVELFTFLNYLKFNSENYGSNFWMLSKTNIKNFENSLDYSFPIIVHAIENDLNNEKSGVSEFRKLVNLNVGFIADFTSSGGRRYHLSFRETANRLVNMALDLGNKKQTELYSKAKNDSTDEIIKLILTLSILDANLSKILIEKLTLEYLVDKIEEDINLNNISSLLYASIRIDKNISLKLIDMITIEELVSKIGQTDLWTLHWFLEYLLEIEQSFAKRFLDLLTTELVIEKIENEDNIFVIGYFLQIVTQVDKYLAISILDKISNRNTAELDYDTTDFDLTSLVRDLAIVDMELAERFVKKIYLSIKNYIKEIGIKYIGRIYRIGRMVNKKLAREFIFILKDEINSTIKEEEFYVIYNLFFDHQNEFESEIFDLFLKEKELIIDPLTMRIASNLNYYYLGKVLNSITERDQILANSLLDTIPLGLIAKRIIQEEKIYIIEREIKNITNVSKDLAEKLIKEITIEELVNKINRNELIFSLSKILRCLLNIKIDLARILIKQFNFSQLIENKIESTGFCMSGLLEVLSKVDIEFARKLLPEFKEQIEKSIFLSEDEFIPIKIINNVANSNVLFIKEFSSNIGKALTSKITTFSIREFRDIFPNNINNLNYLIESVIEHLSVDILKLTIIKEKNTLEIGYLICWLSEYSIDFAESLVVEIGIRYFAVRIRKEKNLKLLSTFIYLFRNLAKKITLDILLEINPGKIVEIMDKNCDFVDIVNLIKKISCIDLSFTEKLTNLASEKIIQKFKEINNFTSESFGIGSIDTMNDAKNMKLIESRIIEIIKDPILEKISKEFDSLNLVKTYNIVELVDSQVAKEIIMASADIFYKKIEEQRDLNKITEIIHLISNFTEENAKILKEIFTFEWIYNRIISEYNLVKICEFLIVLIETDFKLVSSLIKRISIKLLKEKNPGQIYIGQSDSIVIKMISTSKKLGLDKRVANYLCSLGELLLRNNNKHIEFTSTTTIELLAICLFCQTNFLKGTEKKSKMDSALKYIEFVISKKQNKQIPIDYLLEQFNNI